MKTELKIIYIIFMNLDTCRKIKLKILKQSYVVKLYLNEIKNVFVMKLLI